MNVKNIGVLITCRNEAANIERCLQSVQGFGTTVVVDSFSDDDTVAIVRRFPVLLYQRPYRSAADQKNWALAKLDCEWVLILDADEALTPALRAEIESLKAGSVRGYWIGRSSTYLSRQIKGCGWQRDKVLRLFARDSGRYDAVHVHEEVTVQGDVSRLRHKMIHFPYRDMAHHFDKINEYSSRGARDYIERGGRMPLLNMLLHPPFRFLRMFVLQAGWRDGRQGALLCLLASYSVFLKYAKAWELKSGTSGS